MLFCPAEFLWSYALGVGQLEMLSDKENPGSKISWIVRNLGYTFQFMFCFLLSQGPAMLTVWQHCTSKAVWFLPLDCSGLWWQVVAVYECYTSSLEKDLWAGEGQCRNSIFSFVQFCIVPIMPKLQTMMYSLWLKLVFCCLCGLVHSGDDHWGDQGSVQVLFLIEEVQNRAVHLLAQSGSTSLCWSTHILVVPVQVAERATADIVIVASQ